MNKEQGTLALLGELYNTVTQLSAQLQQAQQRIAELEAQQAEAPPPPADER